ncbi:MAG TPA: DUF4440 domain-containing protein [Candidatus Krumholzibacteria bacterium]|nr:DUF4440 domain-containing protein [Candidatus Krumholzibacteria bacterium]
MLAIAVMSVVAGGCARKADIEAARGEVREADQHWAATVASGDMQAFTGFIAPDGALLPPHEEMIQGADAVALWASDFLASPGVSLTWQPDVVEVSTSADMAYTCGTYDLRMPGPDGSMMNDHGKYVTIWRQGGDGVWRVVIDTFNSDLPVSAFAMADTVGTMQTMTHP